MAHAKAYQTTTCPFKYSLQEEEANVTKPSTSDFNLSISCTNPTSQQYLLLNKYSLNKYWEMSIFLVLGMETFCQIHVSVFGVIDS